MSTVTSLPDPFKLDFSDLYNKSDAIAQAYNSGNLVFFLGAGASKAYINQWCGSLKRKLGDRKWDKAVLVGRQTVPLNEQVKQSHCVG